MSGAVSYSLPRLPGVGNPFRRVYGPHLVPYTGKRGGWRCIGQGQQSMPYKDAKKAQAAWEELIKQPYTNLFLED